MRLAGTWQMGRFPTVIYLADAWLIIRPRRKTGTHGERVVAYLKERSYDGFVTERVQFELWAQGHAVLPRGRYTRFACSVSTEECVEFLASILGRERACVIENGECRIITAASRVIKEARDAEPALQAGNG